MLGDVALQRGDVTLAARAYLDAARVAGDARLARRATEVAIASRQRNLVTDAANLWAQLDPAAERPKRVLAALAADPSKGAIPNSAADDELRSRIERVIADAALSGSGVGEVFLQLNQLFAQQPDKRAVLALIREVSTPLSDDTRGPLLPSRSRHSAPATTWQRHPRPAQRSIAHSSCAPTGTGRRS
jgi:hypothetical protein